MSQRLVPILMSEETLAFGMERVSSAVEAQNLLDASNDGECEPGDIDSKGDKKNLSYKKYSELHFSSLKEQPC